MNTPQAIIAALTERPHRSSELRERVGPLSAHWLTKLARDGAVCRGGRGAWRLTYDPSTGGAGVRLTENVVRYACNGCGRETPPTDGLPDGWEERIVRYTKLAHMCPGCVRRGRAPDYFILR